jgi:hypothetical protein
VFGIRLAHVSHEAQKVNTMGRRYITYVLTCFFVISTLAFACPHVYSSPIQNHDFVRDSGRLETDPNQNKDDHKPQTHCYQILHDRLYYAPTQFVLTITLVMLPVVDVAPIAPTTASHLLVASYHSPPNLGLAVFYHVLRI